MVTSSLLFKWQVYMYIYQYLIMSNTIYEQWTRLQYQGTAVG